MAWRPNEYLIEGELDNTRLGKVTGWMQFAGKEQKILFDLKGDFHRDIRGVKIHFKGDGQPDEAEAEKYMEGFSPMQTGDVGDMTAGLPPHDYGKLPYLEWYGDENGRVVLEPDAEQVQVIGKPIPACESDPVSRENQRQHMARFMDELSTASGVPVVQVGGRGPVVSDARFTHWVVEQGSILGEAHSIETNGNGMSFAFVRLFNMPEAAEYGHIETTKLQAKNGKLPV